MVVMMGRFVLCDSRRRVFASSETRIAASKQPSELHRHRPQQDGDQRQQPRIRELGQPPRKGKELGRRNAERARVRSRQPRRGRVRPIAANDGIGLILRCGVHVDVGSGTLGRHGLGIHWDVLSILQI